MKQAGAHAQETTILRQRMSMLYGAIQRINEDLNFTNVLREVADNAGELTDARYGAIITLNESGLPEDFHFSSGTSAEDQARLMTAPGNVQLFEHLRSQPGPLRGPDLHAHAAALGLPDFHPLPVSAFLSAPIRHQGESVGNIFLARGADGPEFDLEDEETLMMFAAQAALVIANARRYREEQRARASLETLVDTSPIGVVVFNGRTGAPESFNREASRIMQALRLPDRPLEELLKVMTVRWPDGQELSLAKFPLSQALNKSRTVRAEELVLSVPDGRSVTVLLDATPIRLESGEVESVVVTFQDMTPLEESARMRAEFLGMVSHELRAPLTSIKGSADTLLESLTTLDPAEMVQFIRIIKAQTEGMQELISELMDVARIETGSLSVTPDAAMVSTLVDEARNTFLSGGGRDNIAIDLEPNLPWVMADKRRIVQVLNNLLVNAARYSPGSSPIEINAVQDDRYIVITVADKGRGISPERLPLLFRKFSRVADEERGGDTGLGLAICKGIVEAHGGRIWAQSDGIGLGSRFTFTLPITSASGPGGTAESNLSFGNAESSKREETQILAVDDDPITLRYVRDTLSKAGYTPVVTTDPDEAFRLVKERPIRLILLDLMLPGSDGIELMKSILDAVAVPVIFLSAYGRDEIIARALESGAADYVVKPFSPTELAARVGAALRRRLVTVQDKPSAPFLLGDLTIDFDERRVSVAGRPVHLTATEYKLLFELSTNAGRVLTHEQLLQKIWGLAHSSSKSAVRTFVRRLRRKLGDDANNPRYIFAEPRVGYRMAKSEVQEKIAAPAPANQN